MTLFSLNSAYSEHSMMKEIDHPNIIESMDFYEDTDCLIIVNKMMSSDVRSLLIELEATLAEPQIK